METLKIASYINERLNIELLELNPKIPYSNDYNTVIEQGHGEVSSGFTPRLEEKN